jgi:hypothetical protein
MDKRSTTLFITLCALVVALLSFLHRRSENVRWPLVKGVIQETRAIADHGLETKWGSELTWKAEYRVEYVVASRKYDVWVDSGIRGESEDSVRLSLPHSRRDCKVRYNPKNPSASVEGIAYEFVPRNLKTQARSPVPFSTVPDREHKDQ